MKKKLLILAVICLLATPVFAKTKVVYQSEPKQIIFNQYEVELEAWIEKLAKCESGNNEKAINENDGGSESIGYVQYKRETWRRYNEKYLLGFSTDSIWSKEAQIEVTKAVIKNDYAWRNWYNCVTKLGVGLPPKQ